MLYLILTLFAAAIAVADQVSKAWIVANLPLYSQKPLIPGLVRLTYVQNTGAAFSSFQGMRWLFVVIFVAFTLILAWALWKKKLPFTRLELWCVAAIYGGAVGNLIDRLRLGYVVDMIETEFISFPVFNVADSFITCGCILLLVHLIVWNKDFWKDDKV